MQNTIFYTTSENMREVKSRSAALVFGSPPYSLDCNFRGKDPRECYAITMDTIIKESDRVLKPGGWLVLLTTDEKIKGNLWSKSRLFIEICQRAELKFVDHLIWKKAERNLFRMPYSHILIFLKRGGTPYRNSHLNQVFSQKIWDIPDSQIRRSSSNIKFTAALHPEIAMRIIARFTTPGDLVLNPFVGSGTIISAANLMQRKWIGYETNKKLKPMIDESIQKKSSALYQKIVNEVKTFQL